MIDALKSVQAILKKYGEEAIYCLESDQHAFVSVVPTGSLALDIALGVGGYPRGRIIEVYGEESSGKSTLCLHAAANCQSLGGRVAFIDAEYSLDLDWARTCGIDLSQFYVSQPDNGEAALGILEELLIDFDLILVDSVAALVPKAEVDGEMGDAHMALQARLMSQAMRKLVRPISDNNACVIFTNQTRASMAMFGPPTVNTGGKALKFYSSVRIELQRKEQIKEKDEIEGNIVKATVKKNRLAPPFRYAEFKIYYDEGISRLSELIDYGIVLGLIDKAGAGWYTIKAGDEQHKVQGMPALRATLQSDRVLQVSIENTVRSSYGLPLRA